MLPPLVPTPWEVYAGDPSQITVDVTDGAPPAPVDLSGRAFTAQWRPGAALPDHQDLTVDTTYAAQGRLILSMTGEQTAAQRRGGVWDVQEVGGATLARGTTTWTADVTR